MRPQASAVSGVHCGSMTVTRLRSALVAAAWWGLMVVAPSAVAATDPPSEPELHPLPDCSTFCDNRYSMIESTTPVLTAVSTDSDSASLTYMFTIEDYMTDELLASEQLVVPQGEAARWQVPAGVVTGGTTYRWNVTVEDDTTTVSKDRYFSYHPPETLGERAGAAAEAAGFYVLVALPYVGLGMAVLGLGVLPWRRRAGVWLLLGGLLVGTVSVIVIFEMLASIGS
jgi:hypothetical protein